MVSSAINYRKIVHHIDKQSFSVRQIQSPEADQVGDQAGADQARIRRTKGIPLAREPAVQSRRHVHHR